MKFSKNQRIFLWFVSATGLFGINGLFLFAIFLRPEQLSEAYYKLYAMVFIMEAFVLLPLFCFLISVAKLKSPDWKGFLILSLQGRSCF
ncbi:MAG TPA: hypothetical protein DDZ36_12960 [Deltaproteobacteria bacterium]|nr:hypothetical protein [Deltaproteobacteria bacterium]